MRANVASLTRAISQGAVSKTRGSCAQCWSLERAVMWPVATGTVATVFHKQRQLLLTGACSSALVFAVASSSPAPFVSSDGFAFLASSTLSSAVSAASSGFLCCEHTHTQSSTVKWPTLTLCYTASSYKLLSYSLVAICLL